MSTTGYYAMVFTEINPTSTLTTIDLWYNKEWTGNKHWVIGPFVVIHNDAPAQTPDVVTPPNTITPPATVTVATATVTKIVSSDSTSISSFSCESLIGALLAVSWLFAI